MDERQQRQQQQEITRDDLWWITDEYLTYGCFMVAQQFIHEEGVEYISIDAFVERATYILRQHCPIVYSFIFTHSGAERLPTGTVNIILNMIRQKRPLFMHGVIGSDK